MKKRLFLAAFYVFGTIFVFAPRKKKNNCARERKKRVSSVRKKEYLYPRLEKRISSVRIKNNCTRDKKKDFRSVTKDFAQVREKGAT